MSWPRSGASARLEVAMATSAHKPTGLDAAFDAYLAVTKAVVITVAVGMLALMTAVNGLEIGGRAFFGRSFSWVQEVSILAAMWVYFFAYALIAKDEEYIRVDFAVNLMGKEGRRFTAIIARLFTIAFHVLLVWFGIETFQFLGLFTTSVLAWPESLFVLPLLLGAIDIVVTELIYLYRQLTGRETRHARRIVPGVD